MMKTFHLLAAVGELTGILLWPAVILHAILTLLLADPVTMAKAKKLRQT